MMYILVNISKSLVEYLLYWFWLLVIEVLTLFALDPLEFESHISTYVPELGTLNTLQSRELLFRFVSFFIPTDS